MRPHTAVQLPARAFTTSRWQVIDRLGAEVSWQMGSPEAQAAGAATGYAALKHRGGRTRNRNAVVSDGAGEGQTRAAVVLLHAVGSPIPWTLGDAWGGTDPECSIGIPFMLVARATAGRSTLVEHGATRGTAALRHRLLPYWPPATICSVVSGV